MTMVGATTTLESAVSVKKSPGGPVTARWGGPDPPAASGPGLRAAFRFNYIYFESMIGRIYSEQC